MRRRLKSGIVTVVVAAAVWNTMVLPAVSANPGSAVPAQFTLPPFPSFPDFTFTIPSIPTSIPSTSSPPPTMPPPTSSPTTSPPPTMPPPTSSPSTSPPPTRPPITLPPITVPSTGDGDFDEVVEDLLGRFEELLADFQAILDEF